MTGPDRSEVLGKFRVVDTGVRERPRQLDVTCVIGFDASGGRADRAALAIEDATGDGRSLLDVNRVRNRPHNPGVVIAEPLGN